MKDLIVSRVGLVWVLLIAATAISWLLGTGTPGNPEAAIHGATITMLVIAFFKVRLVLMHFMEAGHAHKTLRLVCEAWVFGVCTALILAYCFGQELAASGIV